MPASGSVPTGLWNGNGPGAFFFDLAAPEPVSRVKTASTVRKELRDTFASLNDSPELPVIRLNSVSGGQAYGLRSSTCKSKSLQNFASALSKVTKCAPLLLAKAAK